MSLVIERINFGGKSFAPSGEGLAAALKVQLEEEFDAGIAQVNQELLKCLNGIFSELYAKHSKPWTPGNPWNSPQEDLLRRTGGGLKSIKDSIKVTVGKDGGTASISTGGMTIHEIGGTISPSRSKYLTIPSRYALSGTGTPIYSSASSWGKKDTFIGRTKKNNLVIFKREANKTIVPLYMLVGNVRVPPRLGLGDTFEKNIPYFESKAITALEKFLA